MKKQTSPVNSKAQDSKASPPTWLQDMVWAHAQGYA